MMAVARRRPSDRELLRSSWRASWTHAAPPGEGPAARRPASMPAFGQLAHASLLRQLQEGRQAPAVDHVVGQAIEWRSASGCSGGRRAQAGFFGRVGITMSKRSLAPRSA